jgi:Flp pilus assembly protein TadG
VISSVKRLARNDRGAVAPTIALSLVALIAAGGIAFDYARLAAMDTELQNAADQAALAAASQLDGENGACARAAAAAANLIQNRTLMANDSTASNAPAIIITNESACDATGVIRFWQNKEKTTAATSDANAKFVEVQTASRRTNYTLTPVVTAFTGTTAYAQAFAGLGNAICKVPPLMMCNPNESTDPEDEDFLVANFIGRGIRLVANDGGGGYGPGNFGFLDVGAGSGASVLRALLGQNIPPGDCLSDDGVTTQPGQLTSALDAVNTRFDIYTGDTNQPCGADGTGCRPSANTRKDVFMAGNNTNTCQFMNGGNAGWQLPDASRRYLPPPGTSTPLPAATANNLYPMGYPRDICHATSTVGECVYNSQSQSRIGSGTWDRYAYFRSHRGVDGFNAEYPEITDATTDAQIDQLMINWFNTTTPTRYQVYAWEMDPARRALRLQTWDNNQNGNDKRRSFGQPVCTAPGITPGASTLDRRMLTIAVVNCTAEGISGRTTGIEVAHWIDIFMVEPSLPRDRTEATDLYIEVIRETESATGTAIQAVKKSVPYLIE